MNLQKYIAPALAIAITGCSSFHTYNPQKSILLDAEKRSIIVTRKDDKGTQVICAEPSPDALVTYATNASSNAAYKNEVTLSGLISTAGTASNLARRTTSIQLLRDGLFRLCEGYANGALKEDAYYELTKGYQKNMIGLLAVEQLSEVITSFNETAGKAFNISSQQALENQRLLLAESKNFDMQLERLQKEKEKIGSAEENKEEIKSINKLIEKNIEFKEKTLTAATALSKLASPNQDDTSESKEKYQYLDSLAGYQSGSLQKMSNAVTMLVLKMTETESYKEICLKSEIEGSSELHKLCKEMLEKDYDFIIKSIAPTRYWEKVAP